MPIMDEFIAVTGASEERAKFFLEAAGGNLQSALSAFYEEDDGEEVGDVRQLESGTAATGGGARADDSASGTPGSRQPGSAVEGSGSGSSSAFASFADYRPKDKDTKDSQEFFVGGSEHSGQMVAGPPKKKRDIAREVFDAAKKQGAVSMEEEEDKKKKDSSLAFIGTGFRLGDTAGPSASVQGSQAPKPTEKVQHVLRFWSNGFSVDDGPLRKGESEEDKEFIGAVMKGEIPHELRQAARGGQVDVSIEDKRAEEFRPQPQRVKAFSGAGHKLGNVAPEMIGADSPVDPPKPPASTKHPEAATPTYPLDPSQPMTSIQIRLADGTRLVSKFNHTHTVNDIRQYINLCCPSASGASYVLMTTFPNRELTNPSQSLADARLLNAVVVQRMK